MTKKKLLVKYLFGSVAMMLTLVFSINVNALSSEEIFTRILVNNFQYCYQNALTTDILAKNYSGFNSLMNDGFKNTGTTQNGIRIPDLNDSYNKITTQSSGDKGRLTSCYALLYKDAKGSGLNGEMKGLLDIYNVDVPADGENIDLTRGLLADKLQYDVSTEQASSNEYCYTAYVRPRTTVDSSVNLGTYCRNEDNYPIATGDKIVFTGGDENSKYVATGQKNTAVKNPVRITITSTEEKCALDEYSYTACSATVAYPSTVPTEGVNKNAELDVLYWINQPDIYVEVTKKATDGDGSRNLLFRKNNSSWKEALSAITGGAYTDEVPFSDAEKYAFYKQYLTTYYKMDEVPVESSVCQADKPSVLADVANAKYYIFVKNSGWCLANLAEKKVGQTHPMTVFTNDQRYRLNSVINTLSELINLMGELDYSNMEEIPDVDPESPVVDPDNPTEVTCASSGAAESLGWILCPLLNVLSNAANDIYNNTVEPMLQIQPELFSQDDNYGTKYAWDVFQNIANIIFVILFLFVIFSQLTGVGIDNYGIKKILPKLIIAAILVNLSYYICLICVDLSNIIGNGLQSMFDNLPLSADGMATSITIAGESGSRSFSIVSTAITGVALLGVLVAGIWAVIANPAILLSLLVSALGVVIAIFFLFILLSARQAAVIVLTVISPVAFVCYLLPNTKKLFDKYIQLGKGLLLLYPICGLLVGGGNYVSKLLLSSGFARDNGIAAASTAMIIGVVPIFFIPSLLKSSFAVLGNLGAKISGFGERLRGGATRGIRNMEGYKRAQERGAEIGTRIRAGYDRNGNKRDVGRFGRFMRGVSRRGMQREALRYQKVVSDRGSLEATEGEDFMLATETANEMKNIVASGEINDMGSMQNGLRDALESGDRAKIRAYTDGLTAKGEDGRVAVKAAYNAAVGSGRMSTDSARTFANNIMANHAADYKNNNRSMFEVAKNINTAANPTALSVAASTTTGSYVGANSANLAGKVTATTIGNMDDDAFAEMFGGYNGNPVTIPAGASANEIGAAAYAALNDQNANIKAERRKHLEDLVKSSGYQAKAQNVQVTGGTVDTNVLNPVLNVQGTVDVGNEVDVNITQRRGGQVKPVQVDGGTGGGTGGVGTGGAGGGVPQSDLMGVHDDFSGETHVNSGTGRIRTYDRTDMYPRMKGESSEAYGERLRMMREKEEEYLRNQGGSHS